MSQTVSYSISIDNQHCVDCTNFKNLIETAQNMQMVLNCPWSRIIFLDKHKYGVRTVNHVRIDFKLHENSTNYEYLQASDVLYIWNYTTDVITEATKKNIRESIKIWM